MKTQAPAKQSKAKTVLRWIFFILGVLGTAAAIVFEKKLFGENSIFNRNLTHNSVIDWIWQHIPAIIRSIQIVVLAVALFIIVKLVVKHGFHKNNRSITIAKLIESFLKWVIAIAALLFVLSSWGVDAGTLLASAGIVTLVIGLGAQSLVADIVAGVFMVFEGEFQVGDIVIINDWRGTVKEIGIRTTKIIDAGGNINIVNNSEITTVINQTQDVSLAKCLISIEYGASIPEVELVIEKNLDRVRKEIPAILEGPFYKGVNALSASSVDLLFVANCREEDIFQVQRDMNRAFKIIFDENNIGIPFPQIVVNKPSPQKAAPSQEVVEKANRFAEEQKILSKGIEDDEQNS